MMTRLIKCGCFALCIAMFSLGSLPASGADISGQWESNLGRATFTQSGNDVTGSLEGNTATAIIQGTMIGDVVQFDWWVDDGQSEISNDPDGSGMLIYQPKTQSWSGPYADETAGSSGTWTLKQVGSTNGPKRQCPFSQPSCNKPDRIHKPNNCRPGNSYQYEYHCPTYQGGHFPRAWRNDSNYGRQSGYRGGIQVPFGNGKGISIGW